MKSTFLFWILLICVLRIHMLLISKEVILHDTNIFLTFETLIHNF